MAFPHRNGGSGLFRGGGLRASGVAVSGATPAAAGPDAGHPTVVQFRMSSSALWIITGHGAEVVAPGLVSFEWSEVVQVTPGLSANLYSYE